MMTTKPTSLFFGFAILASAAMLSNSARAQLSTIVANDNANTSVAYSPAPDNNWSVTNGGFGYNLWTAQSTPTGGGTYMEGISANSRQVDGNYSFALYAGGNTGFAVSRPLASSLVSGEFDIITRFDIAGNGTNGVDLRTGNSTASLVTGELLSFGIVNSNLLSYTDSTGTHVLSSGEARGDVWDWSIDFNAAAGTYIGSVTNLGGGFAATFSGDLDASETSVGSFGVENESVGNNQNVIFDNPTFSVPEPATVALMGVGLAGLLAARRRK